jgi:2-aminoadipate transaminase
MESFLSRVGRSLHPNAIRRLMPLLGLSEVVSLAGGAPSPETFPLEELSDIAARVILDSGRTALQYGPTRGRASLIEAVAQYLRGRGIRCSSSEIVITTGSQQGLDLISRILIDPGDVVLVELPSYVGGTIALQNSGAVLVGVRQDERGIIIEDLAEKLHRARLEGRRVKCIYTIPNFQNPSGVTLAEDRRQALAELALGEDILIIEDDPYLELYFDEEVSTLKPLASLCPDRVVYLGTFSKVLAPGVRTAWLRAPRSLTDRIETLKEGADLSSSQLDQAIVGEAVRLGLIERRLPLIREFYATRCRTMLQALDQHGPPESRWTRPLGGFFVWMDAPPDVDASEMLPKAIEAGVAYVPGQPFFVDGSGSNTLRLAFSKEDPERIAVGIERLCRTIRKVQGSSAG